MLAARRAVTLQGMSMARLVKVTTTLGHTGYVNPLQVTSMLPEFSNGSPVKDRVKIYFAGSDDDAVTVQGDIDQIAEVINKGLDRL
jgi:hypothetical protein